MLEAARLTGRSPRTIRRWFENEPGRLLILNSPETVHKRRYTTIRIPRHVFERVIARRGIALPPVQEPVE